MASIDKVATKHIKTEPQDRRQEKSGSADFINHQIFKKINPPELPVTI
jgi:hypothetical protein